MRVNGLQFSDRLTGWAWGSAYDRERQTHWVVLFRTEDGGLTWQLVPAPDLCANHETRLAGKPIALEFRFLSPDAGWIGVHDDQADEEAGQSGRVANAYYTTTNGGNTWERQAAGAEGLPPVLPEENGWRVVRKNCVETPADAGLACDFEIWFINSAQRWERSDLLQRGAHFWLAAQAARGWLLFTSGPASTLSARLFRTDDNGQTWRELPAPPLQHEVYVADSPYAFLRAATPETLWLIAGHPVTGVEGTKVIYVSSDGGETWELRARAGLGQDQAVGEISTRGYLVDFIALSPTTAFMSLGREGGVDGTFDGGRSWQTVLPFELAPWAGAFASADDRHAWVVTREAIFLTVDGGRTWAPAGQVPGLPVSTLPASGTPVTPPQATAPRLPYPDPAVTPPPTAYP